MAVNLSPVGGVAAQFFTNSGAVLTGGKLYTYAAGTTTPAVTYTSSQGTTAWTNPVVLDAAGRVPSGGEIWLTDGVIYKFVLKDSNDVLIATYDNITGINSNSVAYTNQQEIITATAGQTVFDLSISYQPGTNSLSVFVDGVNQYGSGASYSYVETDSNTVTFNSGLHVGAEVKFTTTQQQGAGAVDASQVSYDPPFIGSEVTNVEAKLAQIVSPMDFGAVGDGVTADDVAWASAIAYCKANNAQLYGSSPSSFYKLDSALLIDCPFDAGLYQLFSDTATVTFGYGCVRAVYPEWWGANTTPGTTDMTAAINAADLSILGTVGINTEAKSYVEFQGYVYRLNSTVNYNGVPWVGKGRNATVLDYYGNSYAIDAKGTNTERRIVNITGLNIRGTNATAGAVGVRLGHNYRSIRAMTEVYINGFPNEGILFDASCWNMSFYSVYLQANGRVTANKAAIGQTNDPTMNVNAIDFYSLFMEDNGKSGNTIGGGIQAEVVGSFLQWNIIGGCSQSNYGSAEMVFQGGVINIVGHYFESEGSKTTNSIEFNSAMATLSGCSFQGNTTAAIYCQGNATVGIVNNDWHPSNTFTYDVLEDDTALVTITGGNVVKTATNGTGKIIFPGSNPIVNSSSGQTAVLAQNAVETIIASTVGGQSFLVFAHGGVGSNLSNWSGMWLVTVNNAPISFPLTPTSSYVDCVISGMNVQIKNLDAANQAIRWSTLRVR